MGADSKQVPWGKDEKNFEKRVQEYVKLLGGKWYFVNKICVSRDCVSLSHCFIDMSMIQNAVKQYVCEKLLLIVSIDVRWI